mgnify:CR=1 FL=1
MTDERSAKSEKSPDDVKIVFTPSGRQGNVPAGTTVLQAARTLGVDIDSVCGGRALCGRCQITPGSGEFAKHGITTGADSLGERTAVETRYADKKGLVDGRRLSCQSLLCGDVVIDVPPESQVHNQLVRKAADDRQIEMDPIVRLCLVEVREPDMHEPSGDFRRLVEALEAQWPDRVTGSISCDLNILQSLQSVLRAGKWQVTVSLRDGHHIVGIWPGLKERIAGVAIDVGSTTMSAHMCDMVTGEVLASTGAMNPQIRFGEDLMSRVSYGIMNPGGDREMTAAVIEGLQTLISGAAEQAGLTNEDVLEIVLVGNPVMHHLLLGIDPVELGGAPFALAVDHAVEIKGKVGENLRDSLDQLSLFKKLVTIDCGVSLNQTVSELVIAESNDAALYEQFKELGLHGLIKQFQIEPEEKETRPDVDYQTIFSHSQLDELIQSMLSAKAVAIDTETTSLNYIEAELVGISVSIKPNEAFYIPFKHLFYLLTINFRHQSQWTKAIPTHLIINNI